MNGVKENWWYVFYKAASGRVPVKEFIEEQNAEVREKIYDDLKRLVEFNIELGYPYVLKVEGRDFWELRTRMARTFTGRSTSPTPARNSSCYTLSRRRARRLPRGSWTLPKSG